MNVLFLSFRRVIPLLFALTIWLPGVTQAQQTFDPDNPPASSNAPWNVLYNHYGTGNHTHQKGPKTVLVFLVEPNDGDVWANPPTFSSLENQLANASQKYYEASYHQTWFGPKRYQGVDYPMLTVTPVMRLSRTAQTYTDSFGTLQSDSIAEARKLGIEPYDYDRWVVMSNTRMIRSTGLAYVGGRFAWLGTNLQSLVALHEWGHNWGVYHANTWFVPEGEDPNLPARSPLRRSGEYGDGWDIMGGGSAVLFNHQFRENLGFLERSRGEALDVTASDTYRLYNYDHADRRQTAGLVRSLILPIESFTVNRRVMLGFEHRNGTDGGPSRSDRNRNAVAVRSKLSDGSNLLDTTPNSLPFGDERVDSAIKIGRTWSEGPNVNGTQMYGGFHVTPIARGSDEINGQTHEWIDVAIHYENDIGSNQPPTASFSDLLITGVQPGEPFVLSVNAQDPDGDDLAYDWDFGDGGYNIVNSGTQTYTWTEAGFYLMTVTVSDMKGGLATAEAWVNVGGLAFVDPVIRSQPLGGVAYRYYESSLNSVPDFDRLLPVKSGTVSTFSLAPRERDHAFAFLYEGYINLPDNDVYTFWLKSDDGSRLWIGGELVVDNDGLKSTPFETSGNIALNAGWHPVRVEFFHRDGPQTLDVSWGTLSLAKSLVTADMLSHADPAQFDLPSVALLTPSQGEQFVVNGDILIETGAGSAEGIAAVRYFANGAFVGEAFEAPYSLIWPKVSVGTFELVAVATDVAGHSAASAPVTVEVESPPPARSIGINLGAADTVRSVFPNEIAGAVYAEQNWNNMTAITADQVSLMDAMGLAVSTRVSFNASGSQSGFVASNGETDSPNGRLMRGNLRLGEYQNEGGPFAVQVEAVPYQNYDVYVYFDPPNTSTHDTFVHEFQLTPGTGEPRPSVFAKNSLFNGDALGDFPTYDTWNGFREAVAGTLDAPNSELLGNYVVFRDVTTPDFMVASRVPADRDRSFRYFSAVQIVESQATEPGIRILPLDGQWDVAEGGPGLQYEIRLLLPPDEDVTVTIDAGTQLETEPAQVVFTPENGLVPQTVRLSAVNDTVAEGPHTGVLQHQVVSTGNYQGMTVAPVTVQITDNDQPVISVFALGQPEEEGGVPGTFRVVRGEDPHPGNPLAVSFAMSGTATPGDDYTLSGSGLSFNAAAGTGTLTIPGGVSTADITLTPIDDALGEPTETAILTVEPQTAYLIGSGSAQLSILDNNTAITLATIYESTDSVNGMPLSNHRVTFTPNGSPEFYGVTVEESAGLPISTAGHTGLKYIPPTGGVVNNGSAWWRFNEDVSIFGNTRNRLVISMNGYLMFENSGDTTWNVTEENLFAKERIAPLFAQLYPLGQPDGDIYYAKLADRYVVTFDNVSYWHLSARTVTFQAEIHFEGTLVFTYGQVDQNITAAAIGLSRGEGVPDPFQHFDFLALKAPSVNESPLFLSGPLPAFAAEGEAYSHALLGFDLNDLALSFSASGLPSGLSLADHGDGSATLSGTPTVSGTFPIVLALSNGSETTEQAFSLTVMPGTPNTAPVFTSSPVTATFWNEAYTYPVTAADAEGQALSFSSVDVPAWLTLTDHGDGTASLTGTTPVTALTSVPVALRVSDGIDSTEQFFLLQIEAPASITRLRPLGHAVEIDRPELDVHLEMTVEGHGHQVTTLWSQLDGPGTALFEEESSPSTRVRFNLPGYYELMLSADNGRGVTEEIVRVFVGQAYETVTHDGLIGYWSLNESEAPFEDGSGSGFHGSVVGNINAGLEGVEENAIGLNGGTGNYVDIAAGQPTQMTVSAWVYPTVMPATGERTIFGFARDDDLPGARVYTQSGSSRLRFHANYRLRGVWRIEHDLNGFEWAHVVVRYDDSSPQNAPSAFINGEAVAVSYLDASPPQDRRGETTRLLIGDQIASNRTWVGRIDEVKLYDRLVSDHEIHWLMNPRPINRAPVPQLSDLGTGPDQPLPLGAGVTDDGLPLVPGEVNSLWTLEDGPPGSEIVSPTSPDSIFTTGPMSGTYTLRLTSDDGGAKVSAVIQVVSEGGEPRGPTITAQPESISVPLGDPASFSVGFDAEPFPTFAWYKDGVLLPDTDSATLVIPSVSSGDAGYYHVVISNEVDGEPQSAASDPAVLTVVFPPVITGHPQPQTAEVGQSAAFSVTADGDGPLSYQWQKDGVDLDGATAASLTLTDIAYADAGEYRVAVSGPGGTTLSDSAALTVEGPPFIVAGPEPQSVFVGDSVSFTVQAAGTGPLNYQWYVDGNAVPGAEDAELHFDPVSAGDAGSYVVRVSNALGHVDSAAVLLEVLSAPDAPTGVSATAVAFNQIDLSWLAPSGPVEQYRVEAATTAGGPWSVLATIAATAYSHAGLSAESTWHYRVFAINAAGESPASAVVSATTPEGAPEEILRYEFTHAEEGVNPTYAHTDLQSAPAGQGAGLSRFKTDEGGAENTLSVINSTATTDVQAAFTNAAYVSIVLEPGADRTLSLDTLTFKVTRGGTSGTRNFAVRSSLDSSVNLLGPKQPVTARNGFDEESIDLSGPAFQDLDQPVTFYFIVATDSSIRSVEFEDISFVGILNTGAPSIETPVITAWPTASSLQQGQVLSASTLSGGAAENASGQPVAGSFAFLDSGVVPPVGTNDYAVRFTPEDTVAYTTVDGVVPVTILSNLEPTVLIDNSTRNGSFENPAGATSPATHADNWAHGFNSEAFQRYNNGNNIPDGAWSLAVGRDGDGNTLGAWQNSGFAVEEGDLFTLGFSWTGAYQWESSSRIQWRLFTTDDDTVNGTVTEIASGYVDGKGDSGISALDWTAVTVLDNGGAVSAAGSGHELFIEFYGANLSGTVGRFARLDAVELTVFREAVTQTFTVTYNGNGHTGGTVPADPGDYEQGASVTVAGAGDLERIHYLFAGWNTAADGSGTGYDAGSSFAMPGSDLILYAMWDILPPELEALEVTASGAGLSFAGDGGLEYQLEARDSLTEGEWLPVGDWQQVAVDGQVTLEDPVAAGDVRFYRVRVRRRP